MPTLACISASYNPFQDACQLSRTWLNLLAALRPFKPPNEDHRRRPTAGPSYRSSKESLNGLSASPTAFSAPGKSPFSIFGKTILLKSPTMLPPISGARQTSSGAGLKNFRPRGLLAGFFRRTQAHTPEPRPFGIPVELTKSRRRCNGLIIFAVLLAVLGLNAAGVHRPPALRHLRFTLDHHLFDFCLCRH
jgi:hypothetical protein